MTERNSLKRHIRARMAKTGESYTAARRHVVGEALELQHPRPTCSDGVVPGYSVFGGGAHHDSALVANMLRQAEVVDPITGEPFTETMLIGLAGGIGAMYFVFEYDGHLPMLTLLLRHHPDDFVEGMLARLGVGHAVHRTGSARKAAATLDATLDAGRAALCRVTRGALPYEHRSPIGGDNYEVVIVGRDRDGVIVDDEAAEPRRVERADLDAARSFAAKDKHRLIEITDAAVGDIDAGIRDAIAKTVHNLTQPVMGNNFDTNFGFRGLEKLAAELRSDTKKGWIRRFAEPGAQFAVLHRLATGIDYEWGSAQGMRPLYAEFLDEAADRLGHTDLQEAAELFRQSAAGWQSIVDLALPSGVPGLGALRDAIDDVEARRISDASHPMLGESPVDALREVFVDAGGLDDTDRRERFGAMATRLDTIISTERAAAEVLDALNG
jgi:hypothetical protein